MELNPARTALVAVHLQNDIVTAEGTFGPFFAAQVEGPQVVRLRPRSAEARLLYARALFLSGDAERAAAQLAAARDLPATSALRWTRFRRQGAIPPFGGCPAKS